jgi:hypothetical protein
MSMFINKCFSFMEGRYGYLIFQKIKAFSAAWNFCISSSRNNINDASYIPTVYTIYGAIFKVKAAFKTVSSAMGLSAVFSDKDNPTGATYFKHLTNGIRWYNFNLVFAGPHLEPAPVGAELLVSAGGKLLLAGGTGLRFPCSHTPSNDSDHVCIRLTFTPEYCLILSALNGFVKKKVWTSIFDLCTHYTLVLWKSQMLLLGVLIQLLDRVYMTVLLLLLGNSEWGLTLFDVSRIVRYTSPVTVSS